MKGNHKQNKDMFGRINLFPMEAIAEIAVPFDGQVGCPQKLDEKPVLNLNKKKWLLLIFFCVKKQHQPTKNACSMCRLETKIIAGGGGIPFWLRPYFFLIYIYIYFYLLLFYFFLGTLELSVRAMRFGS